MTSGSASNIGVVLGLPSSKRFSVTPDSEAPRVSLMMRLGSASRSCARTPADNGAAPLATASTLSRSQRSGSASSASARGRAVASPRTAIAVTLALDAKSSVLAGSKLRWVVTTKVPPATWQLPRIHWVPPCISGPTVRTRTGNSLAAASAPSCSTLSSEAFQR